MSQTQSNVNDDVTQIYEEVSDWHVNTGDQKVVAKRIKGRFRLRKWIGMSVWLIFFLGPYLRWNGQQAILFDIPERQFNFFQLTIYPQDIWMLSLTLLFFAILLAAVTSIALPALLQLFLDQMAQQRSLFQLNDSMPLIVE